VIVLSATVAEFLSGRHYLGATMRGFAWSDEFGVIVFAKPTARRLPQDGSWLEVVRWCLIGVENGGGTGSIRRRQVTGHGRTDRRRHRKTDGSSQCVMMIVGLRSWL
jgi:hypothetical protein